MLTPQRALLCLAPLFGTAFLVLTPPLQAPDENRHINRAYMISNGDLWATRRQGFLGNEIPWSLLGMQRRLGLDVAFNADVRQDPGRWRAEFSVPLEPRRSVFASMPSLHSPLPYIPQSSAVALLKPLEPPPVALLYAARAANLAVWIALMYAALATTPARGWSLFVLAVTPMSLFVAATASADVATNALAFLWVAWLFRLRVDGRPISMRVGVGLWAFATALGLCKLVYWGLVPMLLLLPSGSFGSQPKRLATLGAIVLGSLVPTLMMFGRAAGITELDPPYVDRDAQLALLRADPLRVGLVLWETLRVDGLRWLQQFVGVLGWLDTQLPAFVYPLWGTLIAAVVYLERPLPIGLARWERALIFGLWFGIAASILLNGFVSWTAPGAVAVRSFQGRYLIPAAPLLAFALQRRSARGLPAWAPLGVVVACAVTLAFAIVCVILRYHGPV